MDSGTVKIYSKSDSPRLRYIAGIILSDILGIQWELFTDKRKLKSGFVINYSNEKLSGAFNLSPVSLLFETGISEREIVTENWNGLPVFFKTGSVSDFPFDVFAASFFLVSRYEEYLEFQPDRHGRFSASSSIAYKNGFLSQPIVDLWSREFARCLLQKFRNIVFKKNLFKALITFDTDEPFAFLGKGVIRNLGGLFHDLSKHTGNSANRYRTLAKGERDPYNVFDYITDKVDNSKAEARLFFPVGDHSEFDKNPSWKSAEYRNLLLFLEGKYKSGIHPSYFTLGNPERLTEEVSRFGIITNRKSELSRFHFIRMRIPGSYRDLIKVGIHEDYSMGYADEPGFRAGIARPYYFYDVLNDEATQLKVFPFQVMDVTLSEYKKLETAEAKEQILKLINETRNVGGTFISIWHNTSLTGSDKGMKWREVFEYVLKIQAE
jgi:hypothetical protein